LGHDSDYVLFVLTPMPFCCFDQKFADRSSSQRAFEDDGPKKPGIVATSDYIGTQ
jgi:hypothetical protein